MEIVKSLKEELEISLEIFCKYVIINKDKKIIPILPFSQNLEEFIENVNKNSENTLIIFFSSIGKDNNEFYEIYKDWLFVIEYYALILEVPFNIGLLREIINKEKKWLKPKKIKEIYNNIKEAMKKGEVKGNGR